MSEQHQVTDEEWDRLIAAAPQMYRALKGLLTSFGAEHEDWANVRLARAAIAKAEGVALEQKA